MLIRSHILEECTKCGFVHILNYGDEFGQLIHGYELLREAVRVDQT